MIPLGLHLPYHLPHHLPTIYPSPPSPTKPKPKMKFPIPITFALFSFGFSVSAQTTDDCAVNDCTPFLQLVQGCGVNLSVASTDSILTLGQANCICGGQESRGIISTYGLPSSRFSPLFMPHGKSNYRLLTVRPTNRCITCLKRSSELDSRYDTFTELCPAELSSGSRSCSVFGGAPYMVGGLMAGMGFFGMAI